MESLRDQIDEIDEAIVALMAKRLRVCREIAHVKKAQSMPMYQRHRAEQVVERGRTLAQAYGVDAEFIERLLLLTMEEACRQGDEILSPSPSLVSTDACSSGMVGGKDSRDFEEHLPRGD